MAFGIVKFGVAVPALLVSTAVFAADLPMKTDEPGFSLSATGSVVGFNLPAQSTGVITSGAGAFGSPTSVTAVGVQGGVSASMQLGRTGSVDYSLGLVAFGAIASGSTTTTDTFTGVGTVVVPGYATPAGTITLTTDQGTGAAGATIAGAGGGLDSSSAGSGLAGAQDTVAVNHDPSAFSLGATSTTAAPNPTSAAAYGAIATPGGGVFVGAGNLAGVTVTTSATQSLVYAGADLSLAASGNINEGAVLQAYAGPSYRYLGQHNTTNTTVTMPAATASVGTVFPTYSDNRTEDVYGNYFGASGGLNLTTKVSDGMTLTVGGQVGLYDLASTFNGTESYVLGAGNVAGATTGQTVTNGSGASGSANSVAYSGGLQGAFTMALTTKLAVTLGGSVEYLSAVPVLNRTAPTLISSTAPTTTYTGPTTGAAPSISFGSMWDYAGSVSLTGQF